MSYNGWENWETWNVALWIGNDESLYRSAKRQHRNDGHKYGIYKRFIREMNLENEETPDGARYIHHNLNYHELDAMMFDL